MSSLCLGEPDAQKVPLSHNFRHTNPTVVSAYTLCRRAENVIVKELESPPRLILSPMRRALLCTQLVYIRLVGHLIHRGPGDAATSHVARSVVSAGDHEQLLEVGKSYLEHFVCAFRKGKVSTLEPTPDSSWESSTVESPPSYDTVYFSIRKQLMSPYPTNHQEAKRRALIRDNFRCVVTGAVDDSAMERNQELLRDALDRSLDADVTECSHILPESANSNLNDPKLKCAGNTWTILRSFGYPHISADLTGSKIHSLKNVLTMTTFLHDIFGKLALWFEATDEPNRYKVCTSKPYIFVFKKSIPRFVTFESTSPELELPSPALLNLHAACCRVAHMSGAVEYLNGLDHPGDDWDRSALTEDLASILAMKLYRIQKRGRI